MSDYEARAAELAAAARKITVKEAVQVLRQRLADDRGNDPCYTAILREQLRLLETPPAASTAGPAVRRDSLVPAEAGSEPTPRVPGPASL